MASKETSANGTIPVASNRVLVTVEVPEDDVHIMSKNQIHFKIDNQTPFTLSPMTTTFADWGDFTSGPTTVSLTDPRPLFVDSRMLKTPL